MDNKDMYTKSEPTEKTNDESVNAGEPNVDLNKLLELPDEELKAKYGIDEPRNWKAYQKTLNKREQEWAKERENFQKQLEDRENTFKSEVSKYRQEFESLKPKPEEEKLEPPKKPNVAFVDDIGAWNDYYEKQREYDNAIHAKEINELRQSFGQTKEQIEAERKLKEEQRNLELVKSYAKGIWLQEGLTPEEAEEAWQWQASAKGDDRLKALAKMFKHSKGNNQDLDKFLKDRANLKMEGAAPGAGLGGGAQGDKLDSNEFTKAKDTAYLYKKK